MKNKTIKVSQKTYERLEEYRKEMGFTFIETTIEELLNIWEDRNEEEDPNYCVNCGDYHD